jgi:hypothetical protein
MDDDNLLYQLGQLLNGQSIENVVPVLIVAAARALAAEAGGDEDKLGRLLNKFDDLLADQAFDMLNQ